MSFNGSIRPHLRRHSTILKGHSSFLCLSKFFLRIFPQESALLFGQEISVYGQLFRCLSISPFLMMVSHISLGHAIDSSRTSLLMGIFGFKPSFGLILKLQSGHVGVRLMQASQNRLWQHGVSTASSNMSRHIGQSHLSSDRPDAAKYVNLLYWWLWKDPGVAVPPPSPLELF